MLESYDLHSRVQLLGSLPHHKVRDVLVKGDIFLNTSLTESFCIAIVEAASCGLIVVSTAVGGVPEVLPPHMLRLAPVSASGLANTLADTIEEVRQQRIIWDQESRFLCSSPSALDDSPPTPHSSEHVGRDESPMATSLSLANRVLEAETVRSPSSRTTVDDLFQNPSVTSVSTPAWPPISASRQIWQRHREVEELYTWPNVAERTEKVYFTAMNQPRGSSRTGMLAALCRLGPVGGKIMALAWAFEWLLLIILEWLWPAKNIDRVPFLYAVSGHEGDIWESERRPPITNLPQDHADNATDVNL
uniref:Glycosyl transferase family 1 domain-containing protein n=2 Tax=Schistocephalus solidus TaxID=70667 RepID=A0A0X3PTM6_SCHSO